jgi:hypothetical protein
MSKLTEETITFGKYKGLEIKRLLRDRKYCTWLLEQGWFLRQYSHLAEIVKNWHPRDLFLNPDKGSGQGNEQILGESFLDRYIFFHLRKSDELKDVLSENEIICYKYYKNLIKGLKTQIGFRIEMEEDNPYNVKTPKDWLKKFEEKYGLSRDIFKEFLAAYELPNITSIIEDIKREGGIEYKGAKSFTIAKERSLKQEAFWEELLKGKYGDDLGTQFQYEHCIFDFILIKEKILFECKLGLKDFNLDQHNKYLNILDYQIVYLISNDCIVVLSEERIYCTNPDKYAEYIEKVNNVFVDAIRHYEIVKLEKIEDYFN